MGLVFFKINKHKKYNYKPVFYDPDKEDSVLANNNKNEQGKEENEELKEFRSKLQTQWHRKKKASPRPYASASIVMFIVLLFALLYLLLK